MIYGFLLAFVGLCPGIESKNSNYAYNKPEIIENKIIKKEIATGGYLGYL